MSCDCAPIVPYVYDALRRSMNEVALTKDKCSEESLTTFIDEKME